MSGKGVWLRGGGEEKSGGAHKFSLLPLQNTISLNWRENWEQYLDKTVPPLLMFLAFSFFFFFLTFPFFGNIGFLFLFLFFFVFSFFGLRVVMGWGKAEGWGLCPSPAWFCLTPCLPRPAWRGKFSYPIPAPWGPTKPRPVKLYFLLIFPTTNTIFLMKHISLIKIYLKLQLNLSHQIK